tara:strand:+ start:430 stop:804 length:375 start_codon:yes stop_codon:yes gene_type:complete
MNQSQISQISESVKYDWNSPNHKPPFPNTQEYKINADNDEEVMKIAVGKKGCNFYRITEHNNIPYIYHDKLNNKIVIWAPLYKAQNVMNQVIRQLNWARNIVKNNKQKQNLINKNTLNLINTTS